MRGRELRFPLLAALSLFATDTARANGVSPNACDYEARDEAVAIAAYSTCSSESGFILKPDAAAPVRFTDYELFCSSPACLKVYRKLNSNGALSCTNTKGMSALKLFETDGPELCFGEDAVKGLTEYPARWQVSTAPEAPVSPVPVPTTDQPSTITTAPLPATDSSASSTNDSGASASPTDNSAGSASQIGGAATANTTVLSPATAPEVSMTDAPTPSTTTGSSGLTMGTVIGIVGAGVGVLAVIGAVLLTMSRRRRRGDASESPSGGRGDKHRTTSPMYHDASAATPIAAAIPYASRTTSHARSQSQTHSKPSGPAASRTGTTESERSALSYNAGAGMAAAGESGWDDEVIRAARIPYEKVAFGALLSRGGFGEVYRGTYRGQDVAIKTLLPERRKDMRQIQNFLAEVKLMATMEHERIAKFIGVAWDSLNEVCVVSEFMDRGDLRTALVEFESAGRPHGFDADKVQIALHVAHALTYMHSLQPVVLHRDLKSRNILLDHALHAKLTDFGVSRERADSTMTAGVGSSLWMAPEVMVGDRYDEKADVFSLGVVLSELDLHALPYANATEPGTGRRLPDTAILQLVSLGRLRVAFTGEEWSVMAQLGIDCVALEPAKRPTAAEALHRLHQIWRRYNPS